MSHHTGPAHRPLPAAIVLFLSSLSIITSTGCGSLANRMNSPRQDNALANHVAQRLAAEQAPVKLTITADAGVVTVRGTAITEEQAVKITAMAQEVQGVDRVDNRVRVAEIEPDGNRARRSLIEDVRTALEKDLPRRGPRLAVAADEGVVYLSGIVPDQKTKKAAVEIAMNVNGVKAVEDNLVSEMK